jgi:hypothetical protein
MNITRLITQISDPFLCIIYNYVKLVSSQFCTVIKFVIENTWVENREN